MVVATMTSLLFVHSTFPPSPRLISYFSSYNHPKSRLYRLRKLSWAHLTKQEGGMHGWTKDINLDQQNPDGSYQANC
jgi:hypothetical protein